MPDPPTFPAAEASPKLQGTDIIAEALGIPQPTKRERFISDQGWFVDEEIICSMANRDALVPAMLTAHPQRTKSYLRQCLPQQYRDSPLCKITLRYEPDPAEYDPGDGPGGAPETTPADEITDDGSTVEQDIRLHPDFAAQMSQYWDWKNTKFHDQPNLINRFTGIEAYLVGSLLVTVTSYSSSEPADIEGDLGTLADPTGRASAAGLSQYLIVSGNKSKNGNFWARSLAYQFNKHGWDDIIYS